MAYLSESNILITLGSYWALVVVVPPAVMIMYRILNEEEVLLRKLPGYREYCGMVRYRLVPGMW
jgi:protein-S-isoprenylcysteine O-methyltransferase Ste14